MLESIGRLVLEVSGSPGVTLVNRIDVSTPNDLNPANDYAESEIEIMAQQPDLSVNKDARPQDPSPGQSYLYAIEVGNNSSVAAGPVVG